MEETPSVAATEVAEASDGDTTESGSVQDDDDYTGLDWNKVLRYQRPHSSLKRAPSYIWDHGWRLQQRYGAKSTVWLCKHCYKHDIKVTLYPLTRWRAQSRWSVRNTRIRAVQKLRR